MPSVVISTPPEPPRRSRRIQSIKERVPTPQPKVTSDDGEESSDEDLNDGSGEEEEEEENEEEEEEDDESDFENSPHTNRNKKRSGGRQSSSAQKKRRKATLTGNIDEIEDFNENYIFQALSDPDTAIRELAGDWIDSYAENKDEAVMNFVNFVLRCCGSVTQIQEHDVANIDSVEQTIAEVQEMMMKQKFHEFSMMSGTAVKAEWKNFRSHALEFCDQVLKVASEKGLLEGMGLVETLTEWVSSMCTSNLRNLRYTAVLFALQMATTLSEITAKASLNTEKLTTRLEAERARLAKLRGQNPSKRAEKSKVQKEIEVAQSAVDTFEKSIGAYSSEAKSYSTYLKEILSTTFAHRYRDTDHTIRQECIASLGRWMEIYPEMFLESSYLRYMGWLLSDSNIHVRLEVAKHLIKLYRKSSAVTGLTQFTERFKKRMIEMVLYDVSYQVKMNTISLLVEICRKGFLEEEEVLRLCAFAYVDEHDEKFNIKAVVESEKNRASKWRNELSKVAGHVIEERYNAFLQSHSSELEDLESTFDFDVKQAVHAKMMLAIIRESYDYYIGHLATLDKREPTCSTLEKYALFSKHLYVNNYGESLEFSLKFLASDVSSAEDSDEFLSNISLSVVESKVFLAYIYGLSSLFVNSASNTYFISVIKSHISKKTKKDAKDAPTLTEAYNTLSHSTTYNLIHGFPDIVSKFQSEPNVVPAVLLIFNSLNDADSFTKLNMDSTFDRICSTFLRVFRNSATPLTIPEDAQRHESLKELYSRLFTYAKATSGLHGALKIQLEDVVSSVVADLSSDLRDGNYLAKALYLLQSPGLEAQVAQSLNDIVPSIVTEAHNLSSSTDQPVGLALGMLNLLVSYALSKLQMAGRDIAANFSRDPQRPATELGYFPSIFTVLSDFIKGESFTDIDSLFKVVGLFTDLLSAYKSFENSLTTDSEACADFQQYIQTECPAILDAAVERKLLQLFLKLEAELGAWLNVELDRDELEDVNYQTTTDDSTGDERQEEVWAAERPLVILTLKIIQLESAGLLDSAFSKRIRLNAKELGEVFLSVIALSKKSS